jgi:3-hydroxybutyryl-CoA dehydrogenase
MTDISQEALDSAIALIENESRPAGLARQDHRRPKTDGAGRIRTTLTLTDLGPTDLVIEAATERETVKQAIFEDLLPHLKPRRS